jgi:hypothetical protein
MSDGRKEILDIHPDDNPSAAVPGRVGHDGSPADKGLCTLMGPALIQDTVKDPCLEGAEFSLRRENRPTTTIFLWDMERFVVFTLIGRDPHQVFSADSMDLAEVVHAVYHRKSSASEVRTISCKKTKKSVILMGILGNEVLKDLLLNRSRREALLLEIKWHASIGENPGVAQDEL